MGEYRTTEGYDPPLPREQRKARLRLYVLAGLLVLTAMAMLLVNLRLPRHVSASGIVTAEDYAEVRSPLSGKVAAIKVDCGQPVVEGQLLVQLENATALAELASARKQVAKAEAELLYFEARTRERERRQLLDKEAATLTVDYHRERLRLTRELAERGLAGGRDVADHLYSLQLAEIDLKLLRDSDPEPDIKQAEVLRREIAVRREEEARAEARLDERRITAPIGGTVLRYPFYPGEVVRPETILFEVFGGKGRILRLRVPERFAAEVLPGQECRAKLRSLGATSPRWVEGRIISVREAIQSEGRQSYRVVYAAIAPGPLTIPHGSTAEASIRTGKAPLWRILLGL